MQYVDADDARLKNWMHLFHGIVMRFSQLSRLAPFAASLQRSGHPAAIFVSCFAEKEYQHVI